MRGRADDSKNTENANTRPGLRIEASGVGHRGWHIPRDRWVSSFKAGDGPACAGILPHSMVLPSAKASEQLTLSPGSPSEEEGRHLERGG